MALAAVGLYGVMPYSVSRRRSEIAVRAALGATRGSLVRMVLRTAIMLLAADVAIGAAAALLLARYAESLLYGLGPRDPLTLVVTTVLLTAVGILAAFIPVFRAASAAPAGVLSEG